MVSNTVKYIFLLSFLYLSGFIKADSKRFYAAPKANRPIDTLKVDTSKYAIFNIDEIRGDFFQLFKKDDAATKLLNEDFAKIEALISTAVVRFNKTEEIQNQRYIEKEKRKYPNVKIVAPNPVVENPANYFKQLVPVINSNKEREVWVRCICQKNKNEWKNDISLVADGGSCYFNLKINLTKNTYSDFALN
jgi:hypothetical protein